MYLPCSKSLHTSTQVQFMSGNICALYSLRRGGRYSAPHRSVPTLVLGVTRIHEVVKLLLLLLLLLWMPRPGPGLADRACGDGGGGGNAGGPAAGGRAGEREEAAWCACVRACVRWGGDAGRQCKSVLSARPPARQPASLSG